MVQVWCVQIAVRAVKAFCPVRATRKRPSADWMRAALPTAESGELASIVKTTDVLVTDAETTGS
jgi:hypothetical protein